jgi:TonB family protein
MADSNVKNVPVKKDDSKRKKDDSPYLTTGERVASFFGWAVVLSLILHLGVGVFFPTMKNQEENQQVEKVSVRHKIHIPTPPPPTPTPPPTPPPPKHQATPPPHPAPPQPKLKLNVVKTTSTNSTSNESRYNVTQGTEHGIPQGQGTAAPVAAPAATPAAPACKTPYQEATASNAVTPDYPDSARELGLGDVTVMVEVTVGPTGALEAASVERSGGNMAIDQAALRAARESTYLPKIVNCAPTSGTYLFRADFPASN